MAKQIPVLQDIAPDCPKGDPGLSDPAGVMLAVDGFVGKLAGKLYAVSLSAGVWKCAGSNWVQLPNSPRFAYCLAVDPGDSNRVVVGERRGNSPAHDSNGAWESSDGGLSWTYILDPSAHGATNQAVPSVAFTSRRTAVMATEVGIFVLPLGGQLQKAKLPQGQPTSRVTAVVASASKVWARLADFTLLVSTDDGLTWTAVPSHPLQQVRIDRGDDFSLGAWDSLACMTVIGLPRSLDMNGKPQNATTRLLIWDDQAARWIVQDVVIDSGSVSGSGEVWSGVGVGGRRFLRSYDGPAGKLGTDRELFLCNAQAVYRATGRDQTGQFQFVRISASRTNDPTAPKDLAFKNPTHDDAWGFHWTTNGTGAWLATDGGIYENLRDGAGWHRKNKGLHTHNAHVLAIASPGPAAHARLTYVTMDNCEWCWEPVQGWMSPGYYGDVNWADSDVGNPRAALFARDITSSATLTGFGTQLPTGPYPQFVLTNSAGDYDFTRSFIQFIQTLAGEQPAYPDLDAVMLVRLPLEYQDATLKLQPVPGPLGTSSGWALIRNQAFAQQPDVNKDQYANWEIVYGDVPQYTVGFWVSGGHANPTYYAYSRSDPDSTGKITQSLLVREVSWKFITPQFKWTPIFVGDLVDGAKYGPAHVNPFNPLHIYILTRTGVMSTVDRGKTWQPETQLTDLLTENGRYPITAYNYALDDWGTCAGSHANTMATLSHMAFNRYAPEQVVAASPFTGVFYNDGSGQWQDLRAGLPQPLSAVSSVAIDNQGIYVALEGRSVVRITFGFEHPYLNRLLEIILEELFQNIVHGIRDDGPGIVGPPLPSPPDPIGPILRQLDPRARDEILGWVLRQLAHLITDEAARGAVHRLGVRLMDRKSIETLGLTLQSSQRPPD